MIGKFVFCFRHGNVIILDKVNHIVYDGNIPFSVTMYLVKKEDSSDTFLIQPSDIMYMSAKQVL